MIQDNLAPSDQWSRWLESFVKDIKDVGSGKILGRCPNPDHPDHRPSFTAHRDEYWYKCFGCGIKGNPIQFAKMFNLDFSVFRGFDFQTGAYKSIQNWTIKASAPSIATSKTGSNPQNIADNSKKISARVSTNIAPQKKVAKNSHYCRKNEAVTNWKLIPLPKEKCLTKWNMDVVDALQVHWSKSAKCLAFPVMDADGRWLNCWLHKPVHTFLKRDEEKEFHCQVYPLGLIKNYKPDEVTYLVEGFKDVLRMFSLGLQAICYTNGAKTTPKKGRALTPLSHLTKFTIIYDNDTAGEAGMRKQADALKACFPTAVVNTTSWKEVEKESNQSFTTGTDISDVSDETVGDLIITEKPYNIGYKLITVEEMMNSGIPEPALGKLRQSDSGNAELFHYLHGQKVRFNHTTRRWHIFDGVFWKPDNVEAVHQLAKETARERQKKALSINDPKEKYAEMKFCLRSEDYPKIISMLNSVKSLSAISTTYEHWDTLDMLFQCENALIDLYSVEPTEILPEYMISQNSGVYYDPDSDCPFFKKYLQEWMNDDIEMCQFIQRVMGYCLTGSTNEQCLFWLVGAGANGKSVLIDVFGMLYGDYRQDTGMDAFMKKYNRNNSNDIARLYNTRVVTANESAEGRRVDEERIKLIAGGDEVTSRFLYHEEFTYRSKMKLIFATNALPRVKDFSEGFWRRVRIIRFDRYFAPDKRIPKEKLIDNLRNELSGILNYALDGLRHFHKVGLNPPKKVIQATQEYRNEEDDVARWFEDCVERSERKRTVTKVAYQSFKGWFEDNDGGRPITQQLFSRRMGAMGYRSEKIGSKRFFQGIEVIEDHDKIPF